MNTSLILAHPNPRSYNHAIARAVLSRLRTNGYHVFFHDLYDEKFDPILPYKEFEEEAGLPKDIRRHCEEIESSDEIVIVHPNWWGQPPAILKGWIDRVLRPGVAYRFLDGDAGDGIPLGLLRSRVAIVFNTSNTPAQREAEVFGDPLERLWRDCIFGLCGVERFRRRTFSVIVTSSREQRRKWLGDVETIVSEYFPWVEES